MTQPFIFARVGQPGPWLNLGEAKRKTVEGPLGGDDLVIAEALGSVSVRVRSVDAATKGEMADTYMELLKEGDVDMKAVQAFYVDVLKKGLHSIQGTDADNETLDIIVELLSDNALADLVAGVVMRAWRLPYAEQAAFFTQAQAD
jgi:hypothetical protein